MARYSPELEADAADAIHVLESVVIGAELKEKERKALQKERVARETAVKEKNELLERLGRLEEEASAAGGASGAEVATAIQTVLHFCDDCGPGASSTTCCNFAVGDPAV